MKKISVIIPAYNAEQWIKKSVSTIISQTMFNELEIIYINDGSTDRTQKILKEETKKYKNIKVINKKNGGVSTARNIGIDNATSKLISFVDIDDFLEPDYFEKLYEFREYDLVISGFVAEYTENKKVNSISDIFEIKNRESVIKEFILNEKIDSNCWNKLYKKKLIGKIRFDEKLTYSEDYLFVFNYILKCNNAIVIPVAKYHYVIHENSIMRKKFDIRRFKTIETMETTTSIIEKKYPKLYELAKSREIDSKCRVLADLYYFKVEKEHYKHRERLIKEIRNYGLLRKMKNSSKKHFYAYILIKINPRLYVFFKKNLKFEYRR